MSGHSNNRRAYNSEVMIFSSESMYNETKLFNFRSGLWKTFFFSVRLY